MRFATRAVHAGWEPDQTGAVNPPIYNSSTFKQDGVGRHRGFEYARTGNPTRAALEQAVADLEGAVAGFAFASGMAALSTILMLFDGGHHLIIGDDVYGGTYRLQDKIFRRLDLGATYVDTADIQAVERAITPVTRAVLLESPTNPLLKITDIRRVADLCRDRDLLLIVDNTFMSPYWQRPLELGAQIVWHSATKYLGGHSDVVAGVAVTSRHDLAERLAFLQNAAGAVLGPNDSYLVLRGLRTLAVRMRAHEAGARQIAAWLVQQPQVGRVYYPGLPEHPGHTVQAAQAGGGFGGMLSFTLKAGAEAAERLLQRVRLFTLAESLGGVESLIELPARMTHGSIPPETRATLGIGDGLIRLSVGIEDPEDLVADLAQAMAE